MSEDSCFLDFENNTTDTATLPTGTIGYFENPVTIVKTSILSN